MQLITAELDDYVRVQITQPPITIALVATAAVKPSTILLTLARSPFSLHIRLWDLPPVAARTYQHTSRNDGMALSDRGKSMPVILLDSFALACGLP